MADISEVIITSAKSDVEAVEAAADAGLVRQERTITNVKTYVADVETGVKEGVKAITADVRALFASRANDVILVIIVFVSMWIGHKI